MLFTFLVYVSMLYFITSAVSTTKFDDWSKQSEASSGLMKCGDRLGFQCRPTPQLPVLGDLSFADLETMRLSGNSQDPVQPAKRSVLTKIPAWVKWSIQTSAALDHEKMARAKVNTFNTDLLTSDGALSASENQAGEGMEPADGYPSTRLQIPQPRSMEAFMEGAAALGAGSNKKSNSNVACFFNPVSCFGRRQSRSRVRQRFFRIPQMPASVHS